MPAICSRPSGSIFVQISDENLHHVREVMDEVFGAENFVSVISFRKTSDLTASDFYQHLLIIFFGMARTSTDSSIVSFH